MSKESTYQAIQLPACVANLDAGLANVDGNDFAHLDLKEHSTYRETWTGDSFSVVEAGRAREAERARDVDVEDTSIGLLTDAKGGMENGWRNLVGHAFISASGGSDQYSWHSFSQVFALVLHL